MTLIDLIKSMNWLSIENALQKLYPDFEKSMLGFKKVFENLKTLEPTENEMYIIITEQEELRVDEDEPIEFYTDVYGRKPDDDERYGLSFTKWENWLGMELAPESIEHYSKSEIIAHILYEISFFGFDQETIQEEWASIQKTADEYENMTPEEREKHTISHEDLMKELNEKYEDLE